MSGVAGVLRFDGRASRSENLNALPTLLRQYGPDRADIAAKDNLGFVHALMRTTPEDRFDRQP